MPEGRLLTVRDIARELGLPESTVRYYRDAFAAHLPAIGTGRRRRYPLDVIPLLRVVAEGYAQNRTRAEIEHALGALLGGDDATAAQTAGVPAPAVRVPRHGDLLATVLDGERERREVMWQMARELVRLGETIERQQVLLTQLAERIEAVGRALPAAGEGGELATTSLIAPRPPEDELQVLRRELAHERELVERLRRSKLDIERRAAVAEARLDENGGVQRRRGLLGKFLSQESDSGR